MEKPHTEKPELPAKEEFRRGFEYDFSIGGGIHHCSTEWNAYHGKGVKPQYGNDRMSGWEKYCANVSVHYRYAMKFSSGIGFDAFWTSWEFMNMLKRCDLQMHGAKAVEESPGYNPFSCGVCAIQNVHYGGFSFFTGVGVYLYKHYGIDEQLSPCYQKIGFKYSFEKLAGMYLALDCKTHYFSRAEMMEFTFGFRI